MAEEATIDAPEAQTEEQPVEPDATTEPEAGDGETERDERVRELWGQALPELADNYTELTPEAREELVLKRLAALAQANGATEDTDSDTSTSPEKPGPPSVNEYPDPDLAAIEQAVTRAFDEGDAESLAELLKNVVGWVGETVRTVDGVIQGYDRDIRDIRLPNQTESALDSVPGAKREDIAKAVELLKKGEVRDPQTALKLAVFNRQTELAAASRPRRPVDEAARRKARAIEADAAARTGSPGDVPLRIPNNPQEERQFLEALEEASKK